MTVTLLCQRSLHPEMQQRVYNPAQEFRALDAVSSLDANMLL